MKSTHLVTAAVAAVALSVPLTLVASAAPAAAHQPGHAKKDTLREAAPKGFYIGTAAAGGGHHEEQPYPDPFTSDQQYRKLLAAEFSSVSPENQMKWDYLRPDRDTYNFGMADKIVKFARQNGQVVRGHTLLWHSQNPAWLEQGGFTKEELREILREHILTVVGRYQGRIQQWDVANEIFNEAGQLRGENIWIRELGPGIVADAFRWAHQADPRAKLFFNDYGVESVNAKSNAYLALIKELRAQRVPVHGFSAQAHLSTRYGFPGDLQVNLQRFDDLRLETAITELDVRMDLPESGTPTEAQLAQQADYYQRTLDACLKVDDCNSFTIWGFTDRYSWVPVFFEGEGSATVMTEDFGRKPAYHALRTTLEKAGKKRR
ncbi:endo-1,4-beta-xylanase [Saccharothrix lopnurensis]|uniref:Beta-xylanase n=1 Tax=Saccharothrix lopnurensis TaxID=1670621 RepID=A0ABW1NYH9_9PSEU